jgi:hypothetical protein
MKTIFLTLLALSLFSCTPSQGALANGKENASTKQKTSSHSSHLVIVDFIDIIELRGWKVEDDIIMGGRSQGRFSINNDGNAVFSGRVSLDNNGGFSSVQHYFDPIDVSRYRSACLRLKGDGKRYRFIVESARNQRHYYVYDFQTGHEWQTVRVPLAEMYPAYRGRRLGIPNYRGRTMVMVRFLIGNNRPESFRLEIDRIWLE